MLILGEPTSSPTRLHELGTPAIWLDAIASCVIGGGSLRGGPGTVPGALVVAGLDSDMSMLGADTLR